jgi:ACS family tartrate transporter-like MFS transporter
MAVARFMTALPLAGVLGSIMAAQAFALGGTGGLAGWKWLFIVTGLPAVLFGIISFFLLADRPSQAKWLTGEEVHIIEELTGERPGHMTSQVGDICDDSSNDFTWAKNPSGKVAEAEASIGAAFKSSTVWHFAFLYFSMSVCMYGFQLWLPQIVQTFGRHTTDSQSALLSAIPALFQGLGMQVMASSSDRHCERRWHMVACSVITFIGLMAACLFGDAWLKLAGISVASFGIWGTLGPFWALSRSCLRPLAQPAGIAFINSIGGLGGFVGPYAVGLVKGSVPTLLGRDSDFAGALVLLAAAAVLTAILAATSKISSED